MATISIKLNSFDKKYNKVLGIFFFLQFFSKNFLQTLVLFQYEFYKILLKLLGFYGIFLSTRRNSYVVTDVLLKCVFYRHIQIIIIYGNFVLISNHLDTWRQKSNNL